MLRYVLLKDYAMYNFEVENYHLSQRVVLIFANHRNWRKTTMLRNQFVKCLDFFHNQTRVNQHLEDGKLGSRSKV